MKIRLSQSQQEAVNHDSGALLVVAGPGSGKTRVLTERIRRLLTDVEGHFHVLALTFTNKAANEMKERLADVPQIHSRAFIGTIHSFCTEVLVQRGKSVGVDEMPQIVDARKDQRMILREVLLSDPDLAHELRLAGDEREQQKRITHWLDKISRFKTRLLMPIDVDDEVDRAVYEAYQSALRRSQSVDFDDLLLLAHQLLTERPKVANFFRRLYAYICVDEGQDLNYAQYQIICDLAGDDFKNIMIVGDPKQAIYGFNTADPKYLDDFKVRFDAKEIELRENYRSSSRIVQIAQALKPRYNVQGILPIEGEVRLFVAEDEAQEATFVVDEIRRLRTDGHPDIEGTVTLEQCAVLCRTRYGLLEVEQQLKSEGWRYYKQWSGRKDLSSDLFIDFELCLRVVCNPRSEVHVRQLSDRWNIGCKVTSTSEETGMNLLTELEQQSHSVTAAGCLRAIRELGLASGKCHMPQAIELLKTSVQLSDEEAKRAVYEDAEVLTNEWDLYLRSNVGGSQDLKSFLVHSALGTTQQMRQEGLALITVHSAKGLEFDVVFLVGMAQKTFPDYRSLQSKKALEEEQNNAFVAVSRSRRLLYLSYPKTKVMPWGDVRPQQPSQFLRDMELV